MTNPLQLLTRQDKKVFWWTLALSCIWQAAVSDFALADHRMWVDQIKFFVEHDQRQFDFYRAYCQPGTTLVNLGALFHLVTGFSYSLSYDFAIVAFLSLSIAFCCMLCQMICPDRPWWFTTLIMLNINRVYLSSTPPTALILPMACALFLLTAWVWNKKLQPTHQKVIWTLFGIIVGVSTADRVDASVLLGAPFFLLLTSRFGFRFLLWSIPTSLITFVVFDPYLWFMPVQHVMDFWFKITMHYSHFDETIVVPWNDWLLEGHLCAISIAWFVTLFKKGTLKKELPLAPIWLVAAISVGEIAILSQSKFQAIRYLFPLIIIWQILLPLFVMITFSCRNKPALNQKENFRIPFDPDKNSERLIALVVLPIQVIEYLFRFY